MPSSTHAPRAIVFRIALSITLAALGAMCMAAVAMAAGPPFPEPVSGQAVYDPAEAIDRATQDALEARIDAIEARSGAEIVVYAQVKPGISEEQNLADARALMDAWSIGRSGFDDGLVLMLGLDETRRHGRVSLFGGAGFLAAYADEDRLKAIIDDQVVPNAREGDLDGALIDALDAVDQEVTPGGRDRLNTMRQINAVIGLVVAPITLLLLIGIAYRAWRREGDDPEYLDSPSVLMAGPPAEMTPALATVVREGRAKQHSLDTILLELASRGRIGFVNLDRVKEARSDSEPNPLLDPAIVVRADAAEERPLGAPEQEADAILRRLGGGDRRLSRDALWSLNDDLGGVKALLDREVVRLGWFAHLPGPAITRWTATGIIELALGGVTAFVGLAVPISGATLLGGAIALAGVVTVGFGQAMSKRTPGGAIVEAMLKAYRRTLEKTLEQARSMAEVVEEPTVRLLAETPDKAVVWGFALGLHRQVATVLERNLEDVRDGRASGPAYYPYWISSPSASRAGFTHADGGASVVEGSGSGFSGSGIPDVGSMFSALGSVGSTPPSASSGSGGGFGGGGSSGGGGASGSF